MKAIAPTPSTRFQFSTGSSALRRLVPPVRAWLLASWQAGCRRAERPDRFVPHY